MVVTSLQPRSSCNFVHFIVTRHTSTLYYQWSTWDGRFSPGLSDFVNLLTSVTSCCYTSTFDDQWITFNFHFSPGQGIMSPTVAAAHLIIMGVHELVKSIHFCCYIGIHSLLNIYTGPTYHISASDRHISTFAWLVSASGCHMSNLLDPSVHHISTSASLISASDCHMSTFAWLVSASHQLIRKAWDKCAYQYNTWQYNTSASLISASDCHISTSARLHQ